MEALKVIGKVCGIEFLYCCMGALLVLADTDRARPGIEGPVWFLWVWAVSGLLFVGCFIARLRIVKRVKIEQVAKGVKKGYVVREIMVKG